MSWVVFLIRILMFLAMPARPSRNLGPRVLALIDIMMPQHGHSLPAHRISMRHVWHRLYSGSRAFRMQSGAGAVRRLSGTVSRGNPYCSRSPLTSPYVPRTRYCPQMSLQAIAVSPCGRHGGPAVSAYNPACHWAGRPHCIVSAAVWPAPQFCAHLVAAARAVYGAGVFGGNAALTGGTPLPSPNELLRADISRPRRIALAVANVCHQYRQASGAAMRPVIPPLPVLWLRAVIAGVFFCAGARALRPSRTPQRGQTGSGHTM